MDAEFSSPNHGSKSKSIRASDVDSCGLHRAPTAEEKLRGLKDPNARRRPPYRWIAVEELNVENIIGRAREMCVCVYVYICIHTLNNEASELW